MISNRDNSLRSEQTLKVRVEMGEVALSFLDLFLSLISYGYLLPSGISPTATVQRAELRLSDIADVLQVNHLI